MTTPEIGWQRDVTPAVEFTTAVLNEDVTALRSYLDLLANDELDPTVVRLSPLAYRLCKQALKDHPAVPILGGIHRKAHFRNNLLLRRGGDVAARLQQAGLNPVALKGAPLLARYYPDTGARPMSDIDVLLPPDADAAEVTTIVAPAGLQPHSRQVHAWTFVDRYGLEYDLHRHLSPSLAFDAARLPLNMTDESVVMGGTEVATLTPAGHVAHSLVHSTYWNTTAPIRWIPDIALIDQSEADLKWEDVADIVAAWGWLRAASDRVNFLVRYGLVRPHAAVAMAGRGNDARLDLAIQQAAQSDPRQHPLRHIAHRTTLLPLRLARRSTGPWSYRDYLRDMWEVDGSQTLLGAAVTRMRARLSHGTDLPVFNDAETPRHGTAPGDSVDTGRPGGTAG